MPSEHAGTGAVRSGNGSRFRRCGAVLVHVQCWLCMAEVQCHVSGLWRAVVKCAVALGGWAAAATGWGIAPPLWVVATRWPHGWLEQVGV